MTDSLHRGRVLETALGGASAEAWAAWNNTNLRENL